VKTFRQFMEDAPVNATSGIAGIQNPTQDPSLPIVSPAAQNRYTQKPPKKFKQTPARTTTRIM
jgi:hypothetical protein